MRIRVRLHACRLCFCCCKCLAHQLCSLRWSFPNTHASGLERTLLTFRGSGGAGDDSASMAHGLSFRRGKSGDVRNDWLGHILRDVVGCVLLSIAADLANHHDCLGVRIPLELFNRSNVSGTNDWITADTNAGGKSDVRQLVHHLIGQRAGFGYQADGTWLRRSLGRDNSRIRLTWSDEPRAVRANDAGVGRLSQRKEFGGVLHWNTFRNYNSKWHAGVDSLFHSRLGELRGDKDDGDVRTGGLNCFAYGTEDRDFFTGFKRYSLARLLRVNAANNIGTRTEHALGVLHTLGTGHALNDDLGIRV